MKNFLKTFLISTMMMVGTLFSIETYATHTAGMDIFYRWVSDSTYKFTIIFYRNCEGPTAGAPDPTVTLTARSNSISSTSTAILTRLPTFGAGVPALQPSNMYNCTQSTNLCYEEYYYRGNWTSRGRADDWVFSAAVCCRPGGANRPQNVVNPGGVQQWIECGLNNKDFPEDINKNWSPVWHNRRPNHPGYLTDTIINYLFRTLCEGNYYTLDMKTREYQGDSLSYEMSIPQGAGGVNIPYAAPWSFLNPMPITPAYPIGNLNINPITGIIPVIPGSPTANGIYVLGLKCTEWRNDTIISGSTFRIVKKEIGWVKRDMTIWIDPPNTCRKDSIHPADVTITDGCGDTNITVTFHTGITNDPNSLVRCNTISEDGSEFRVLDYTNYVAPYDSTIRSIGVHKATWVCRSGVTDKIILHLAEGLNCQDYTIMLKTGTDLDVLESECGFLEPEWSTGIITMNCPVDVNIDTNNILGICLPAKFPKIFASSSDTTLQWFWVVNGDTSIKNGNYHDVPYIWTDTSGIYKVTVIDEYNCVGSDQIEVFYDTDTSFFFNLDPYCDKYGQKDGMPTVIVAPFPQGNNGKWEWTSSLGTLGFGDTLQSPNLVEGLEYTLIYTKNPITNGVAGCVSSYTFIYDREHFPPQDPLWVNMSDNQQLCMTDDDSVIITTWENGIRNKYSPMHLQWYHDSSTIPGTGYSKTVSEIGLYRLKVTDSLGCWGEDTTRITDDYRLNGPFVPCGINGDQGEFTIIWSDESNNLIVSNLVSYDNGLTWIPASNGNSHLVNNIVGQKFIWVRGLVDTKCQYTEMSISEECPDKVYPPNVITPNGDGLNDVFDIKGLELFDNSKVTIYDRWGNIVYENSNYKNDWDGGNQPEGTYYYILDVDDPQETIHKGVITLLR